VGVTPAPSSSGGEPMIGISMDMIGMAKLPFFSALLEGGRLDWFVTKSTVVGLYTLISQGLQGKATLHQLQVPSAWWVLSAMLTNLVLFIFCLLPRLFPLILRS